ncbi:MAG: S41 family peptidase [Polyangiaceae bacterium]|nr:S41 family peptidase [Polyangiaceae bacterium]
MSPRLPPQPSWAGFSAPEAQDRTGAGAGPSPAGGTPRLATRTWLRWSATAAFVAASTGSPALADTAPDSPYRAVDQMARVLALIEDEYVEPVDHERLVTGAIRGMVGELDPHSEYLVVRDYTQFQEDTEGRFAGIGVEVDFRDDAVVVLAPIEGTPAARAGIRPGDHIIAIDGESVRGLAPTILVERMRGRPGTAVRLTVTREHVSGVLVFTLVREIVRVPSVAARRLARDVGYVRIKQFQTGTHTELLQALGELRRGRPLVGILLDLRNNPGGLVDEASAVADEFLVSGTVYSIRRRGRVVDTIRATPNGALRRGPVVVLVNEYTASAAELVAGALQDHHRAVVIGARTFGKGSVQTILDLPGGDGLRLTTMRYYTPNGRAIQAQGVEPTIRVEGRYDPRPPDTIVRESDLDHHLPAEGATVEAPPARTKAGPPEDEPPPPRGSTLPPVNELPEDPTGEADLVLSLGYQLLVGLFPVPR